MASAAVVALLRTVPPVPAPAEEGRWAALRDRGYVAVTALDGIMSIQHQVLLFALPLWIVERPDAPRWLVGPDRAGQHCARGAAQARASRGGDDTASAGRAVRRSGVAFRAGMAAMAAAPGLPTPLAATVIVVGICVHTVGELWHSGGSLELRFSLAPAHAQGQYWGLFGFGGGLANVVAPTVLALCCVA
ncbi:hypothetical protein [Micromonospora sp. NPDC005806]|uniref:hypothetical protein n=1 Tax=Micromonospora sp. NPDC005806 TaxID=3364234 RepID=UPI0036CD58F8